MKLTSDVAFSILMDLMRDNPDKDSASVLVMWGDRVRVYDDEQAKAVRRSVPMYYALMHGVEKSMSSDASTDYTGYEPDEKHRVPVELFRDFCREHHLPYDEMQRLVRGEVREVKGWRVYFLNGALSREWKPERDLSDLLDDEPRKPRKPYSVAKDVVETVWSKER